MATITERKRKDGLSYLIRSSCGYTSDGRQRVESKTWKPSPGMTPRQIEKELKRQATLFDEQCATGAISGNVKFQTLAEQWFKEYAQINLRPRTVDRLHQHQARTYAALGHLRLDKITTRAVQSFINNLSEEGINKSTGGGLSPKTIRNYLSFVSDVMQYAVRMGMILSNPCSNVILPPLKKKEKDIYTIEETQAFLDSLQAAPLKYKAFFVLAIYGGLRRGELLGLEWSDIEFGHQLITIRRTSLYTKEKGIFTDTTKTENSRRVMKLPSEVFEVLRQFRAEQRSERLQLGDQWQQSDRIFVTWNGSPMHPNTTYQWLKRFCESTGQRFLGIHQFRHLNATLLIGAGVDAKTVSASLGHTQVSTTLNIYAHTFAQSQARASQAVADVLALGKKRHAT